jgi:ribonuclease HI
MDVIFNAMQGRASKSNNDILIDIVDSFSIFPCKITLQKCRSHQGLRGNEIADRLANQGANKC